MVGGSEGWGAYYLRGVLRGSESRAPRDFLGEGSGVWGLEGFEMRGWSVMEVGGVWRRWSLGLRGMVGVVGMKWNLRGLRAK